MAHPKNLLLPTDFSTDARYALDYAVRLAREYGAPLHLLHVVEPPLAVPPLRDCPMPCFPLDEIRKGAQARLEEWIGAPSDVDVRIEVRHGRPAAEIVDYSRHHGIELIVMGTHGRRGLSRVLMGSTTEAVLRSAPCPVLTLRAGNAPPRVSAESLAASAATPQPPQEVARAGP